MRKLKFEKRQNRQTYGRAPYHTPNQQDILHAVLWNLLTLFGGQRVLLFCLCLLQLGFVKPGNFCQIWFVRHASC